MMSIRAAKPSARRFHRAVIAAVFLIRMIGKNLD